MLNILSARLQQYVNRELPDVNAGGSMVKNPPGNEGDLD